MCAFSLFQEAHITHEIFDFHSCALGQTKIVSRHPKRLMTLSNILAVVMAVKSRIQKISTQFVKWSVAVRIYLLPLSVSDKGPSMSVESLSRVNKK